VEHVLKLMVYCIDVKERVGEVRPHYMLLVSSEQWGTL